MTSKPKPNKPSSDTEGSGAARSEVGPAFRQSCLWLAKAIGLDPAPIGEDTYEAQTPERLQSILGGEQWRFTFSPQQEDAVLLHPQSAGWSLLCEQWRKTATELHLAPVRQPHQVHEISAVLLDAYQVQDGHTHLGGCTLDDRGVVLLTAFSGDAANPQLRRQFYDRAGEEVAESLREDLKLNELAPVSPRPRASADPSLGAWIERCRQRFQPPGAAEWVLPAVVWCKFAEGKVVATINDSQVQIPFAGWAAQFASGQLRPPPYVCPATGVQSYRLAITDDGVVTASEAIASCAATGRRLLRSELVKCPVTEQFLVPSRTSICPVSQRRLSTAALETCSMCRQAVDPACLSGGRCAACRSLAPVRKDDPRMAQILGEHPRLDGWRRWRLAETSQVYVLTADALLRRLLLVVDRQSYELLHLGVGSRFSNRWEEAPESLRRELLR